MNKLIKIISVSIIILSILSFISGCIDSNAENKHISNGEGEEFTFLDTNGNEKNLSDFRGKIVILDMWATWCSPCGYQMLELEKLYNYYDKEIIEIISIYK
jgi:thiol-disulfide isomerase/thioredoxin